jgi:sodium-dependent dicarboxylate transporter 2/3/5
MHPADPSAEPGGAGGTLDGEAASPRVRRVGRWLGPLLFLAVLALPDVGLDARQRRVLAVTAWTAAWWITTAVPIGAASLLPAALLPLLGAMDARDVAPAYMKDLVLLFLGAFLISVGLERWNLSRRMAVAVLSVVGSRPRNLVFGFMLASASVSLWMNNTSTTLLLLPIGLGVIDKAGGARGAQAPFAAALVLGIAYSASVGGTGTPVGTAPNQIFLGVFRERFPDAPEIGFAQWILAWLPLVLLYLPLGWLLLTRVALRVPAGSTLAAEAIQAERASLGRMARGERWMAAVFVVTVLLWLTREGLELGSVVLPGWGRLLPSATGSAGLLVTDATVAVCMALLCFVIPVDRRAGTWLLDWKAAERIPWNVLLLFGGGFALADAFAASGLDRTLGEEFGPLLIGMPEWLVVLLVVAFLVVLSEIASNTAITALMLPVLSKIAVAGGISPLTVMLPATIAASAGFMLPVATPPNAVVFASGHVSAPTMARVGLWLDLLLIALITGVFQLWARRVLEIAPGLPTWAEAAR